MSRRPSNADPVTVEVNPIVTVVQRPLCITQRNADHLGLSKRQFLDMLAAYRLAGGSVGHHGQLRAVDAEQFAAWLTRPRAEAKPQRATTSSLAAELGLAEARS